MSAHRDPLIVHLSAHAAWYNGGVVDFHQNNTGPILATSPSKKILPWIIVLIIIVLLIFVGIVLLSGRRNSQPVSQTPQAMAQEQLNELNSLEGQRAPAATSAPAAVPQEAVNNQIKTLNSLKQEANSQPLSPAQVQNQLNELNMLRSK